MEILMSRPFGSFLKDNAVLIAGIALPVLLIVVFVVARAIPSRTVADPQYKLVYAANSYENYTFTVDDNHKLNVTYKVYKDDYRGSAIGARLYIFDGASNTLKSESLAIPVSKKAGDIVPIALKDFGKLNILPEITAPDGYSFRDAGYRNASLITEIFTYHNRRFEDAIVKDGRVIPLKENGEKNWDVKFIGWVAPE